MSNFEFPVSKQQAIAYAKRKAKKHPGNAYVVYLDHRDETCREFYDVVTLTYYQQPYSGIPEHSVVMIIDYDAEARQFTYE